MEIKPHRHHAGIVVGGLQGLRQQPAPAAGGNGRFICVTRHHPVASSNFQRFIPGQRTDVHFCRDKCLLQIADFHVINRHRISEILVHLQSGVADFDRIKEEFPFTIALNHTRAGGWPQFQLRQTHQAFPHYFHWFQRQDLRPGLIDLYQPDALPGEPVPVAGILSSRLDQLIPKLDAELGATGVVRRLNPYFISARLFRFKGPLHPIPRLTPGPKMRRLAIGSLAQRKLFVLLILMQFKLCQIHSQCLNCRRRDVCIGPQEFLGSRHIEIVLLKWFQLRLRIVVISARPCDMQAFGTLFGGGKYRELMHAGFQPDIHRIRFVRGR